MKRIHCNITGNPIDTPFIHTDTNLRYDGVITGSRVTFELQDIDTGGAELGWSSYHVRFIIPLHPGDYEGSSLGLPDITYENGLASEPLTIKGDRFLRGGLPFPLRGSTDFRLLERVQAADTDTVERVLEDRALAGANYIRVLSMKMNNTGWELRPEVSNKRQDNLSELFELLWAYNCYGELTVFADTKALMPYYDVQEPYYAFICDIVRRYPHIMLELLNENEHPTQNIDPGRFNKPDGILSSHGSGLTDVQPVTPLWDYATYHARRSPPPPNAKPFNNLNPYEFHPEWPHPVPYVCEESVKPEDYGYNPEYAAQMGRAANLGPGAIFHHNAWNEPRVWYAGERECAKAFYAEIR